MIVDGGGGALSIPSGGDWTELHHDGMYTCKVKQSHLPQ